MKDRVSTVVLGLDGLGKAGVFADYSQWEVWQREQEQVRPAMAVKAEAPRGAAATKKKLSYLEAREFEGMEKRIAEAEEMLGMKRAALDDPAIASDGPRLMAVGAEVEEAQKAVDALYARWAELEAKLNG
jgi:ATP-binding cassette subfamily F protein uup